jgi:hypothetical protein
MIAIPPIALLRTGESPSEKSPCRSGQVPNETPPIIFCLPGFLPRLPITGISIIVEESQTQALSRTCESQPNMVAARFFYP